MAVAFPKTKLKQDFLVLPKAEKLLCIGCGWSVALFRLCVFNVALPDSSLPFGKGERQKERETDNRSHADLFYSCCSAQLGEAVIEQTTDVFDLQTACVKFSKSEWNGAITSRCFLCSFHLLSVILRLAQVLKLRKVLIQY